KGVVDAKPVARIFVSHDGSVVCRCNSSISVEIFVPELARQPAFQRNFAGKKLFFCPDPACHFEIVDSTDWFTDKPGISNISIIIRSVQPGDFIPVERKNKLSFPVEIAGIEIY